MAAKKKTPVATTRPSDEIRTALTAFVANAVAAGGSGEIRLTPPASAKALQRFAKYPPKVREGLSEVFGGISARLSCTWDLEQPDKARPLQDKVGFCGDVDLRLNAVYAVDASDFAVKDDVWDNKLSLIDTGSGDMIAMDLTPKFAGQVVYLSHDLDRASHGKVIAPTFAEFVRRWVALGCFALDGGAFRHFCSPSHRYLDAGSPFGRKWLAAVGVEAETKPPAPKKTARKAPAKKQAPASQNALKTKPKKA